MTQLTTLPDEKNVPKPGTLPQRFGKIENLAGNEELCKKVKSWLFTHLEHFRNQEARQNFCDDDGVMDNADRMERVALRRDTSHSQYQATLSDVASTAFRKGIRAMTAGQSSVFFNGTELPAKYEPVFAGEEYSEDEGRAIVQQQNMLEDYTWERDRRRDKVKDALYFCNKYGQHIVSMEWDFRQEEKVERVKTKTGFTFQKKKRTVADHPTLISHDLKNLYFDAQIDDLSMQRVLLDEREVPHEDLLRQQINGWLMNVEKITSNNLSDGDYNDETLDSRKENAGEDTDTNRTGLIKAWHAWARMPIKGGKWDESVVPELYWCTFSGNLNSEKCVCHRMIKNPYFHGKIPYKKINVYRDDKGAYHVSPAETVLSLYWQAVTNINQAIDNVTLRNRAPMIIDGPLKTRDITYKANKLIKVGRGVQLKPIDVPRTTEVTMEMADRFEEDIFSTLGTDKPILGLPLLGRTSATEATNVLEAARVPLLEQADDVGRAFFGWMLEMDAELWRQYGDPALVLSLTKNDMLVEFKPAELYGPYKVTITAITQFENKVQKRRELNSFLQNGWDKAAAIMGRQGQQVAWRTFWTEFGFRKVNEVFPPNGDYDAERVAINESYSMLTEGVFEDVEPSENHLAHNAIHEPINEEYKFLPDTEQDPERRRIHEGHIQKHKTLSAQQATQGQQIGAPQEGLPGELAANNIEAELGAEAAL